MDSRGRPTRSVHLTGTGGHRQHVTQHLPDPAPPAERTPRCTTRYLLFPFLFPLLFFLLLLLSPWPGTPLQKEPPRHPSLFDALPPSASPSHPHPHCQYAPTETPPSLLTLPKKRGLAPAPPAGSGVPPRLDPMCTLSLDPESSESSSSSSSSWHVGMGQKRGRGAVGGRSGGASARWIKPAGYWR